MHAMAQTGGGKGGGGGVLHIHITALHSIMTPGKPVVPNQSGRKCRFGWESGSQVTNFLQLCSKLLLVARL